jgi:hypothetical protein
MGLRDRVKGRVIAFLVSDERTVCFDDDPILVAEFDNFALLGKWVQLHEELALSLMLDLS